MFNCLYVRLLLPRCLDRFSRFLVHRCFQQGEGPSRHEYCENFCEVLVTPLIASMTRPAPPFATLVGLTIGRLAGRDWRLQTGPGPGAGKYFNVSCAQPRARSEAAPASEAAQTVSR